MDASAGRLRVLFAIPHLAKGGGAERVMLTLLRHIDRARFEPQLMVLDAGRNEIAADLPADVPLIDLGVTRVRYAARPIVAALRRTRPDVLLSGLGHLNLMISMMRPMLPYIAVLCAGMLVLILFPWLTLVLPRLLL